MPKVIIASKNPVKINAIKSGFEKMFPEQEFEFEGISAASEVSDQPMSDAETYLGVKNRVKNAKIAAPDADFWAGIEAGLHESEGELENYAYVLIASKTKTGKSRTATFTLSKKVSELIRQGYELGTANDMVFAMSNSKQKAGSVGILTKDVISRTTYCEQAVILALIPFINPDLY